MNRVIRVDDEVFAKLQSLAEPFVDTPNSALRRVLGLPERVTPGSAGQAPGSAPAGDQSVEALLADGRLRVDQRLVWRRRNLRQEHHAVVLETGALRLGDGSVHSTPSGAATHAAGNPQNGWKVWATEDGTLLKDLR